ncbi:MAG: GNAT family N-acetyltransferase [Lactobacillus sp.]|nr:GNAT family N-acetyltransferase [Lactobacillus sp.]
MTNIASAHISALTQNNALKIANNWHYEAAYAFYDAMNDQEDYQELITPQLRGNRYFQVVADAALIGFFCLEPLTNGKVEIGLGLKPEMTGQGLGIKFLSMIEAFVKTKTDYTMILLSVAMFNLRAQKVYHKAGYQELERKMVNTNQSTYEFVILAKPISR